MTRQCNLRCSLCQDIHWLRGVPPAKQSEGELTNLEWKRLIDETGLFSVVTFTGGEPWRREDFPELIEYGSARRRTHLLTNATQMDEPRAKRCVELAPRSLFEHGLFAIGVSLHGLRDTHDRIVGQPGAFEKSMGAVQALASFRNESGKKWPYIHITAVLCEQNIQEISELVRAVSAAGANTINLARKVEPFELERLGEKAPWLFAQDDFPHPHIQPDILRTSLEQCRITAEACGIGIRFPNMPLADLLDYYNGGYKMKQYKCRAAWSSLIIGANGNAYPCFAYQAGNIHDQSIKEIWNGGRMREFRRRLKTGLFACCQGCCFAHYTG